MGAFIRTFLDTQGVSSVPSFAVCPGYLFIMLRVAPVPAPLISGTAAPCRRPCHDGEVMCCLTMTELTGNVMLLLGIVKVRTEAVLTMMRRPRFS